MNTTPLSDAGPLLGREVEQRLIASLLAGIRDRGGALLLRGEPGIGKSRLLAEAATQARESDILTLSTAGIQTEANLAFAGLHHLLRPVRAHAQRLPPVLSSALDSAFGLADDPAPSPFRIAMAVLDLLSEAATDEPLLLLVEDAHWLDRPTADALAFVARRLSHDPVALLAATRDGYESPLLSAGLPEHRVDGLTHEAAVALLEDTAGRLPVTVRARILREAAGNPLALQELRITAGRADEAAGQLPLTDRLEQAFGARVSELPDETRVLLVVTALSEQDDLDEVLAAAAIVSGTPMTVEMLEPAERAGIVELDVRSVRFRHPLMRSAVRQTAGVPRRRRAHQALAEVLRDDPDRRVWHRAALVGGPDETVAVDLEEAARRASRRGAVHVAFTALRRAAELSDPAHRGRRLLSAAELAVELGTPELAAPLLREVGDDGGPVERARALLIEELVSPTQLRDVARAARIVEAGERAGAAGERDLHLSLIWRAVSRAWWTDPGPDAREVLVDAARRLRDSGDADARVLAIYAYADPRRHAAEVLPRLHDIAANRSFDTESARHLGPAALVVGAFDIGMTFLSSAVDGLRSEGRLGHLPRMLTLQGIVGSFLAAWDVAVPAGEEARRIATELAEPFWIAGGENVMSMVAAIRGDADEAERSAARAEQLGLAAGGNVTVAIAQFGRVLAALGESRHDDAFASASKLFDPTDPAFHPVLSGWLIGDLAEAAQHAGRADDGRRHLAQVESAGGEATRRTRAAGAHAGTPAAEVAGERVVEGPLCLGIVARQVRASVPEVQLEPDARPWTGRRLERARRELRASGESSWRRDPAARDQMSRFRDRPARAAASTPSWCRHVTSRPHGCRSPSGEAPRRQPACSSARTSSCAPTSSPAFVMCYGGATPTRSSGSQRARVVLRRSTRSTERLSSLDALEKDDPVRERLIGDRAHSGDERGAPGGAT